MSTEIERKIEQLTQRKQELKHQIAALDESQAREAVLDVLRNQRHYFFKNNGDVVFDSHTQYLWTTKSTDYDENQKLFPGIHELISDTVEAEGNKDFPEIRILHQKIEGLVGSKMKSGFTNWAVPTVYDYWCIADNAPIKSPDNSSYVIIRSSSYSGKSVYYNTLFFYQDENLKKENVFYPKNLTCMYNSDRCDYNNCNKRVDRLHLINKSLSSKNYAITNLERYSEKERQKVTEEKTNQRINDCLDIFINHGLVPIFDKSSTHKYFDTLSELLPPLKQELFEVEESLARTLEEKEKQRELLSSKFDYRYLLEYLKLDCATIDTSVVKYAEATIAWSGVLLSKIAEYEMRQTDLITKSKQATEALSGKYYSEPNLTEQENQLLANRQAFMQQRFNLDFAQVKHCIANLKHQGHNLKQQLAGINALPDSIGQLGTLHHQVRAPFDLLTENSAMQIIDKLKQMEFYEENTTLIDTLITTERRWADDFKALKTSKTNSLVQLCNEDGIEQGDCHPWLQDWYELRLQLEIRLQALLECGVDNRLDQNNLKGEPVLMIIEALEKYKLAIDEFYISERKGIHQEMVFNANANLQEKMAVETALYKLNVAFQQSLQQVIFGLQDIEQRLFVFHWAESITSLGIGNVVDFIRNQNLDQVSEALLNDFTQLKLKNYASFIDDAQQYAKDIKEQEKEYTSLMFRMRKELNKAKQEAA